MPRTCETCAAFNREHLILPVRIEGTVRFPSTAQCRRLPPPWPVVEDTDWCGQWSPRQPALHEDNGA